ncbi:biotin carboxylase [Tractidigestivibacter scatoligenes]|uniref:Biotin carboxylase n=1 Tax=Tractidigestivibacter scatoligenes TaxID=1299998 RepID=A0A100YVW0_TRASO|nr:ATP-binding protein [Tractidigestivibacter scatoligenes]KUH58635.1 biotin carboxylase [Tractidigestivibacter scatoligenes]
MTLATPEQAPRVPRRIAQVIINSLKGGVVPRVGLPYITVGRDREVAALLHDLDLVADGGASFRFLVGRYGSGKSFLLQTIRNHAMGRGFVVADADLSPERRLQGTGGQGLATYRELIRNLSTKTRPEGGALNLVLDRWVSNVQSQVTLEDGLSPDDLAFADAMERRIMGTMASVQELVHGYDFARLLTMYWRAHLEGDDETKANVTKWFRGEYRNKTEARRELGVGIVIGDDDWYDYLKILATFLVGAGYKGLVILLDEMVNLYKIPNAVSRQYNYEKVLTMYNDTLQGKAHHLGIIMSGTPQAVEDRRRGLYSYEALRSRLTQGRFSQDGLVDMLAPVIRLEPLTHEELLVLVEKLADIHAGLFGYQRTITQDELVRFLETEYGRVGADTHLTPREVIRDFVEMLDILSQNPGVTVEQLLGSGQFTSPVKAPAEQDAASFASPGGGQVPAAQDEFAEFDI